MTNFWKDTLEELEKEAKELTVGTVKKAVEQIVGNREKSPQLRQGSEGQAKSPIDSLKKESEGAPKNYTELDKKKLGETYQKQDDMEIEALKSRLFKNVQSEGDMAHREAVKTEQERLKQYEAPLQNPQQKESFIAPKGKKSKNIFGGRRKAVTNMENSPAKGK